MCGTRIWIKANTLSSFPYPYFPDRRCCFVIVDCRRTTLSGDLDPINGHVSELFDQAAESLAANLVLFSNCYRRFSAAQCHYGNYHIGNPWSCCPYVSVRWIP